MPHRLYMDVHVPWVITEGLRRRGIDVLTAQTDQTGNMADDLLLERSTRLGRILFSQDEDLLAIAASRQSSGRDFAGLIYAHQLGSGIGEIIEDLVLLCLCADLEEVRNRVIYLPLR